MITNSDELFSALKELQTRSEHVVNTYKPSDKLDHNQLSFHRSKKRYRLITGGNQSGKSHAAAWEIARWAIGDHPHRPIPKGNIDIWVISAEYITITSGIYKHLKDIIPPWMIKLQGPKIPNTRLPAYLVVKREEPNAVATITFMSSKGGEEARKKFQAAGIHLISIDEEISPDIWEELQARTIATGGEFIISATLVESYDWILNLEKKGEQDHPQVFLTRLNTLSNDYRDIETVNELMSEWSEETIQYRIFGKSRRSTGLIYNTFSAKRHVIKPFKVPIDWPRWCAIDPGIRVTAVLWITVGPDEHAYAYRELYARNEALYEVARAIKTAEGWKLDRELSYKFNHFVWESTAGAENLVTRLIDPSSRRRSEAGDDPILAQLYEQCGLLCTLADNTKRAGIEACRFWLEDHDDNLPRFRVFSTLDNFINEIREYRLKSDRRPKNRNEPADEPIKARDHLMDDWRYIAMEHPKWADRILQASSLTSDDDNPSVYRGGSAAEFLRKKKRQAKTHEFLGTNF